MVQAGMTASPYQAAAAAAAQFQPQNGDAAAAAAAAAAGVGVVATPPATHKDPPTTQAKEGGQAPAPFSPSQGPPQINGLEQQSVNIVSDLSFDKVYSFIVTLAMF